MRHQKAFRKLGRNPTHRRALFRNLATSLIIHDRIETTLPKAKELKRVADKLVTLGKKNTLHARRQALGYLFEVNKHDPKCRTKDTAVHKLFTEIAPSFSDRNGGYTRVLRTRVRDGDKAQMAIIEFVSEEVQAKDTGRKKRRVKKSSDKGKVADKKAADQKAAPVEEQVEAEQTKAEEAKTKEPKAEEKLGE